MLKHITLAALIIPLGAAAFACSSEDDGDKPKNAATGGSGGSGGGIGVGGSAGGISVSGGSAGSNGSGASSGTGGDIPEETADGLRMKACAGWTSEPELLPTVLQLVVDTSLSMDQTTNATNGRTKWEITQEALGIAIESLPATTALGVLYYPNMGTQGSDTPRDVSACVNVNALIPVALLGDAGSAQRETIADSLDRAGPDGSTPTHDAYHYALENGLKQADEEGNKFMLVITDGAPTLELGCLGEGVPRSPSPTQPIVDEVLATRNDAIRTFIIGSPGTEDNGNGEDSRPWMSRAAALGGTARSGCSLNGPNYCHIDLSQESDFAGALNAALARILGQIVSCSFELPAPPAGETLNLSEINVIYSPGSGGADQLVGRDDSPDCQEGWQLDASNRVVLCPAICDAVQRDPQGTVELLFGCASEVDEPVR
jgi:hypothetical protein